MEWTMSVNPKYGQAAQSSARLDVSRGQFLRKHGMVVVDFQDISEVIGIDALRYVIHRVCLEHEEDDFVEPYAAVENDYYSRLHSAIRDLYGQASHGILNRIGRITFRHFVEEQAGQMSAISIALRLMPLRARKIFILRVIARTLNGGNQQETVYLQEDEGLLNLIDTSSPACHGISADEPICWHTVGFIEEALQWATCREFKVEEVSCQAQGVPVCTFAIAKEPTPLLYLTWR